MDVRMAVAHWAAQHKLDRAAATRLEQLAGLHDEPIALDRLVPRGVAVLAAALGGLGIVFWIAANWDTLGRFGRFALLDGFAVAMCAGAWWRPAARAPFALLAMLAIGALFAHFGQTYQTGADPWQLFAIWAALALPLCLGARSDVLWAPWALVVMCGVSLWMQAHTGHRWRVQPDDLEVHLLGWSSTVLLVAFLSAPLRRWTGAGMWGLRTAIALAVVTVGTTAMVGLFSNGAALHFALGVVVLAGAAAMLSSREWFDLFGLSAVALGLDALLLVGLGHAMLHDQHGESSWIAALLVLGLAGAALVALTVMLVMRLARRSGPAT